MKVISIAALLLVANMAQAAIQVSCKVDYSAESGDYTSSSVVTGSLAEGKVTGSVDLGQIQGRSVSVSVGAYGSSAFASAVCVNEGSSSSICADAGNGLTLVSGGEKTRISCRAL